jgi:hypothetical protein
MTTYDRIYRWANNPKRAALKGRRCRVVCRLAKNSALVEFETGQREVVSRSALRREKTG